MTPFLAAFQRTLHRQTILYGLSIDLEALTSARNFVAWQYHGIFAAT